MPGLLIKNLPPEVHRRLKDQASAHHRSMVQEALTILESGLGLKKERVLPEPIKLKFLLTNEMIDEAKREGRE